MDTPEERLAAYLRSRIGDDLRSVSSYDEDGVSAVYRRPGITDAYTDEQLLTLAVAAQELNDTLHAVGIDDSPLGEPNAGVYGFENAYVLQFPVSETEGVIVTIESGVGTALGAFLSDCAAQLN